MKKFTYEARDKATGNIVKSLVQAESESEAAKALTAQGYMPLSIKEEVEGGWLARFTNRISSKDKIVFSRQLATLIGAGLPLTQSLHTVFEQTANKKMQEIVQEIIADVEGGKTLSSAFGKHPEVFNKIFIALVTAGEASGTLDDALKRIADQQEKDAAMVSKIRGAMVYPGIVLAVMVAVGVFMMVTIVPQVAKLYSDMKKTLPVLTSILIGISNFVINFWWLTLILLALAIFFARQYVRTEAGSRLLDNLKLNMPPFKGMFRRLYMARFTRMGQTLLVTGVPMLDMLAIAAEGVNNAVVAEEITRAAGKVQSGKALSAALQTEDYILPMVPQMIKIGEQSGRIDEMMGKTAQAYEDELDEEIQAISTMIEPIMMVILAIFAGVLIGAVLFPIYSLVGSVR
ncbi:type II secretion system F family protein [Candidatus Saccharibacteria bacterium]|jgi:pilin biogenesis protein|nr:type II secretion system F family protein [Candidatus Saccharibacteria bacterium]MBF1024571.1 type II secretion system F family protein [Candidatus Nanogingivalaceae bacterium]MBF1030584.1 type II secretion system F family protein [Candidatus Nanosynbacter sp.]RKV92713.1 MAG: type II secretion system F family protein [Candidatus Saccharimonas sp.]TWP25451.1 type II secretion system F family protein [TM7 phylum sp. oral taxon 346]